MNFSVFFCATSHCDPIFVPLAFWLVLQAWSLDSRDKGVVQRVCQGRSQLSTISEN